MTAAPPKLRRPTPRMTPHVDQLFPISVEQYEAMVRQGILTAADRVELLDGFLVHKIPQNEPHSSAIRRLTYLLIRLLCAGWTVQFQLPIRLSNGMPEPDAAIIRGDAQTYDHRKPTAADFGIVIEVADTTLLQDRTKKRAFYAADGIPEFWLVNLAERTVTVMTGPQQDGQYAHRKTYSINESIPVILDSIPVGSIAVADVLPHPETPST